MSDQITITPPVEEPLEGDTNGKAKADPSKEEPKSGDRPEWLPEKFKNPEELAKAYGELETKLGKPADAVEEPTITAKQASDTAAKLNFNAEDLGAELAANDGKFTDETYAKFEEAGFGRDIVDSYVAGQQALASGSAAKVHELAGGVESFNAMREWAKTNMSEGEIASFDAAMRSGDDSAVSLAVKGLKADYESKVGVDPKLVTGTQKVGDGPKPFLSQEDMVNAMRDPRYKESAEYRKQVEGRIAVSKLWG